MSEWWEVPYKGAKPSWGLLPLARPLYPPDASGYGKQPSADGDDCEAIRRVISRLGRAPWAWVVGENRKKWSNTFAHGASGGNVADSGVAGFQRQQNISPAYGWTMLLPFDLAVGPGTRWITTLCLAALFLPLGYWAAWTRRPLAGAGALAGALLLAFAVLPGVAGFPPVHWSEWLGGVLGAATGWAVQRPAAYLQRRCASPSGSEFSSS